MTWQTVVLTVIINVASNIVFWLGGGLVFGKIACMRRGRLHRLFGIKNSDGLLIYFSSVTNDVSKLSPTIPHYKGTQIFDDEHQVAVDLINLFGRSSKVPDVFQGLVDSQFFTSAPRILMKASPAVITERPPAKPTVCIGGPKYNTISGFYLSQNAGLFRYSLIPTSDGEWELRDSGTGRTFSPSRSTVDYALLMRLNVDNHTVIIAAGLGVYGTIGAVEFLTANWDKLQRMKGQFQLVLQCRKNDSDEITTFVAGTSTANENLPLPDNSEHFFEHSGRDEPPSATGDES